MGLEWRKHGGVLLKHSARGVAHSQSITNGNPMLAIPATIGKEYKNINYIKLWPKVVILWLLRTLKTVNKFPNNWLSQCHITRKHNMN